MPVSNPNKTVSQSVIGCEGQTRVTLSFDAASELNSHPADIVLIMDRSGSMYRERMTYAKSAAKQLVRMVAAASGGDGTEIANGTRIALVSFADDAAVHLQLSTEVQLLENAIGTLTAQGKTNHKAAFEKAAQLLEPQSSNRRIMVMFTDGLTTVGGDAGPSAEAVRNAGTEIFCIGLTGDPTFLNAWASDPDATHVVHSDEPGDLNRLFEQIAAETVLAGAYDVLIQEQLNPDFKITHMDPPSDGVAVITGPQTIRWEIGAAGITPQSTISLSFDVMHIGAEGGTKKVNQLLTYRDREGTVLEFPNPEVEVICAGPVVLPESCPEPVEFTVEGCRDSAAVTVPDVNPASPGRIVQVNATVKNVCPDKKLAVAILLTETDEAGVEHVRGMKTLTIPPQGGEACRDLELKCIHFVVPEEGNDGLCAERRFSARVMANYADTDFVCCDPQNVIV